MSKPDAVGALGASHEVRGDAGALSAVARACDLTLMDTPRVHVDRRALAGLTQALTEAVRVEGSAPYGWDDAKFWPVWEESGIRSQLLTVGNALNFRFWRTDAGGTIHSMGGWLEGEYFTGSMYLWRRLLRAHSDASTPIASATFLADMDGDSFDASFADDRGDNPLVEGLDDRIANLRDLGRRLLEDWEGQFSKVIEDAAGSLPSFIRLSRGFRAFDDPVGSLTLVNALMHRGSGLATFNEPLLPAIDYQILKQLLRQQVVIPDAALASKLRTSKHLTEDEALQLRYAALDALLRVGDATGIPGDVIDNQIWQNRVICTDATPIVANASSVHFASGLWNCDGPFR